uniref:Ataxin 2 n=1 Tax=Astyanax mexicanus TaxID=7994 RepID=A0A8B9JI46_ASTMX
MRMVHVLTSVVGNKCELKVKNGVIYEGVFKTYGPECDLVLDAAHRKSPEPSVGPRREDIIESIIFKSSDVVVVHFKDVDLNYAKKDNFTDNAVSSRLNGEHKEKDLEPWDGGEQHASGSLESLDNDLSNGWDPDDMFKYNEETYGVKSTYDSSLSSYTVPLERDNSEEFLKREARAAQLAEEIEGSASYKARVALENDERSEEEKYTAVVRDSHTLNRENKYIPPGQRNREAGMSWGAGRQNSPRLVQCSPGPPAPRAAPHDYGTIPGVDQRVVNGGAHPWPTRCPSPSSRPPSRYQSGPTSLPPRAATPTRPPSRPPSRPSRPPSHPSAHGSPALSTVPKRLSSEGPPRMSPKSQRTPRTHRVASCRGGGPSGADFMSQGASGEVTAPPPARSSPSGGTWSSVVSGGEWSTSRIYPVFETMVSKAPRDPGEKPKEQATDKSTTDATESSICDEVPVTLVATAAGSKPSTPSPSPSSALGTVSEQKRGPDVTSQGVQTSSPAVTSTLKLDKDDKEDKKDPVPEILQFYFTFTFLFINQPKPATTPTLPRPQGQPSPSIVVQQPAVYGQHVCFPQMYPLTPVSPGVQSPAMYHVPVPHMTLSQSKPYRTGKVPNMPQQRPDQHHQPGTSTMMHPNTAAGPHIVAPNPAYSTQYFTCSPQQFASQPLVQQMPHYQSQAQHVFSPVMQGSPRMITPPTHGQPSLVSSSTTQYGEQTHTMYGKNPSLNFVFSAPIPQQYPHPSATLHPHPQHPQPSATPTGQAQQGTQHGGSHPAPSPVQHSQHQAAAAAAAAQALHLGNPSQQQMYSALAPTPPSMTPGPNPQSPQASFPSAQQAVYIHPSQVQHGYNPNHMAHVQQAHMQSGMVPTHHGTPSHPVMLMAAQPPAGPQPPMPQGTLNPIPVSSTTHFSYMAHPQCHGANKQQQQEASLLN